VFVRAFRTPDLRKKLLFTGAMIVLFRFGSNLPAPGISEQNVSCCSRMPSSAGVFAILNLLSGNSLLHLTVFGHADPARPRRSRPGHRAPRASLHRRGGLGNR
jgi:preprotein translocase subunit SecY